MMDNAAAVHHPRAVGYFKREPGVLLDQKEGDAAFTQAADNGKNVLHHLRQTHRRFVEDQQARAAEQGAVKRQQLLLTAGKQASELMLALPGAGSARKCHSSLA